jgi:hypothetical protein
MKTYGGMYVKSHVFLTWTLAGGGWSASRSCSFNTGEERAKEILFKSHEILLLLRYFSRENWLMHYKCFEDRSCVCMILMQAIIRNNLINKSKDMVWDRIPLSLYKQSICQPCIVTGTWQISYRHLAHISVCLLFILSWHGSFSKHGFMKRQ